MNYFVIGSIHHNLHTIVNTPEFHVYRYSITLREEIKNIEIANANQSQLIKQLHHQT